MIELGISSFGETTILEDGSVQSHHARIQDIIKEIELADEVGLDIYALGEHHREDFAISAPEIVLAAAAVKTKNIRLSTATTNISTADPVRVYQNFATVDALSCGRAEIMLGRSSFTEGFPLFGYNLRDYEALFNEKTEMLLKIREDELLNWNGHFTQSIDGKGIYPRAMQDKLPIWIATGGNPNSSIRIAKQGLPIAYAIIGGNPLTFKRLIELYKETGKASGYSDKELLVAAHSWGFIAEDRQTAIDKYYHPTKVLTSAIARERMHWRELSYEDYLNSTGPQGAMFVGSPDDVADKLIFIIKELGINRYLLHIPIGSMPHNDVMNAIRLFGEEVAPRVRKALG